MNLSAIAIQKALNNQWEEAAEINDRILLEEPQNIDALNRLAQAYIYLKKYKEAKGIYLRVLEFDQYNPIAKRNLIKLKFLSENNGDTAFQFAKPFNFIEEPGKTKVISLVRIGERTILSMLQPCHELDMHFRCQTISCYYDKNYIGRLPDDIAKRLIWLYKRDNKYSAFIKSIDKNRVMVFIKETKRSLKNKNYYSFINSDKLSLESLENDKTNGLS